MADTDQERTEDPTEKRLSEARDEGQIARSKELGTAVLLIVATVSIMFFGSMLAEAMVNVFKISFSVSREQVFDPKLMFTKLGEIGLQLMWPMFWILSFMFAGGIIGNIMLGGFSFSWKAAAPKFSKMSPIQGFKRMLGIQALVELLKSIAKVAVVGGMVWAVLHYKFSEVLGLSIHPLPGSAIEAVEMLQWMLLLLVCSLVIIAIIDVPYQIWNHNKQLKMTKQEVKDEHKNTEGNPEVKGRIRRLQMEMAARRMMADVPQADVVVTNPEHYSVALKYDTEKGGAPMVVAKGVDEVAMKIREVARHYEIHIMPVPSLARSLYHTTKIGAEIPEGLFVAVAQVLAYIFQLEQYRKGRASKPNVVDDDVPIPEELRH